MKKTSILLITLFMLALSIVKGQYTFETRSFVASSVTYTMHIAIPDSYYSNSDDYPTITMLNGLGEVTTSDNRQWAEGPMERINNTSWAGKIKVGDITYDPIYVSYTYSGSSVISVPAMVRMVDTVAKYYRVDKTRQYVVGLSAGAKGALLMFTDTAASATYNDKLNKWCAAWIMSAGPSGFTTGNLDSMTRWVNKGGRMHYMIGAADGSPRIPFATITTAGNKEIPNAVTGQTWTNPPWPTAGHGGWNYGFDSSYVDPVIGMNAYQYLFRHTKQPYAKAPDNFSTSGTSITLNGSTTEFEWGYNGWDKTVTWSKVSGGNATITNPNSDTTTVTGLEEGTYVFRLTSANAAGGLSASADVTVNVVDHGYAEDTYSPTVTTATNFSEQYLHIDRITFLNFKTFNLYSRVDNQSAGASSFSITIPDRVESSLRGVGSGSIVYDNGTVKPIGCTATGTTMACKFDAISGEQGTIHISGGYQ